jgi:hypothetical protein
MGKADHQERKLLWLREQFDPAFQGGVPTRGVKIAGNPWHLLLVHLPGFGMFF